MPEIDAQFSGLGRHGRRALQIMEITGRLVIKAKQPGFCEEEWNELAALVNVDRFQRIAANREQRDWHEDIRLRHQFALVADFTYEIRRIAEAGNTVFFDVIENLTTPADSFSVNTLGVMEFDEHGLLLSNKTYQQWDAQRVPSHVGRKDAPG